MSERQLATIRKIAEVQPITGADKICAYRVDGWWVVDQVGRYNVGDLAVYLEVDSWVPHSIAPFLTKPDRDPMVYEGIEGQRLRTIRLKGQLSQGLLLPLEKDEGGYYYQLSDGLWSFAEEGDDLTSFLGIIKWEKPMNAQLAGMAKGNFPSFIPKTDQPRIQNLTRQLEQWQESQHQFSVTEKMDGSSMTVYLKLEFEDGKVDVKAGVCSRNLDLKYSEDNSFWKVAVELDLINKILLDGRSLAIQGELCGPGIQGNQYGFTKLRFFCYDIFDIDRQVYLLPDEVFNFCATHGISMVPVDTPMITLVGLTVPKLLDAAEGISTFGGKQREGVVYKSMTEPNVSFKVISNKWLLKNE